MELRVLRYFLALAREESIEGAAEVLHVTQPMLSRQLTDLEDEIGNKLFLRGIRKITLTEDGVFLQKRAQEVIDLVDKTVMELSAFGAEISGVVSIGGGESDTMRLIARTIKSMRDDYPRIRYRVYTGNSGDVIDLLDNNVIDFGFVIGTVDMGKYQCIRFTDVYICGLFMRKDSKLADTGCVINPEALQNIPLIYPRYALIHNELSNWLGYDFDKLNIVSTYNLFNNARLMVEEGVGYAVCLNKQTNINSFRNLRFEPLEPQINAHLHLVWKRSQHLSKAAGKFLHVVQKMHNR